LASYEEVRYYHASESGKILALLVFWGGFCIDETHYT